MVMKGYHFLQRRRLGGMRPAYWLRPAHWLSERVVLSLLQSRFVGLDPQGSTGWCRYLADAVVRLARAPSVDLVGML